MKLGSVILVGVFCAGGFPSTVLANAFCPVFKVNQPGLYLGTAAACASVTCLVSVDVPKVGNQSLASSYVAHLILWQKDSKGNFHTLASGSASMTESKITEQPVKFDLTIAANAQQFCIHSQVHPPHGVYHAELKVTAKYGQSIPIVNGNDFVALDENSHDVSF